MQKFSKKSSLALTLCILSAISSSGYAAEKSDMITYSLDEVVVTATKTELTQKENPRSVEVITKEDIQNTGAISVRDALRTATNIDIVSVNHGGGENISIRGRRYRWCINFSKRPQSCRRKLLYVTGQQRLCLRQVEPQ